MKQYRVYVNSGNQFFKTAEPALKLAKELLNLNVGCDIKVSEIEPQKE